MISIYVDGVSRESPGPGGWAVVVVDESGKENPYSGAEGKTTALRMGIKAAMEGLMRTPPGSQITLHSTSAPLVRDATQSSTREGDRDLWASLDRLAARRSVSWEWVEEFAGVPMQEKTVRLAREAAGLGADEIAAEAPAEEDVIGQEEAGVYQEEAEEVEPAETAFSHLNERGEARMVDISHKADTERVAVARGRVVMEPATLELIRSGGVAKGDVLSVARIAGIMGAKRTPELVPMCHPLLLTDVTVELELNDAECAVEITATVKTTGKTGVEMEALTAVSVSALTIYDMCKSADRHMRVEGMRLVRKRGGKSGDMVLE